MRTRVPIGISDFRELREGGFRYIDKSNLICELIDRDNVKVILLPRPRRFGKTLNLSMLRYYFEKSAEDASYLFEGLKVWEAGARYRAHFRRYPVCFLTLRDVKALGWAECYAAICQKLQSLFGEHRYLAQSERLSDIDRRNFEAVRGGTAEPVLYKYALENLIHYLRLHHGERPILLIDEYDQPIHASFLNGYFEPAIDFFRALLTSALKDNVHLGRAVLTGVLRVARESIFSGLNNLGVYTLLRYEFEKCFGFNEDEVRSLLEDAGRGDQLGAVRDWYNGYMFGREVIYNPWSILSYVNDERGVCQPYWLNTSSNDLVKHLLGKHGTRLQEKFELLMAGEGFWYALDENVALNELETNPDALWSLLVFSGYLKAEGNGVQEGGDLPRYRLCIPNREVRHLYVITFQAWFRARMDAGPSEVDRLLDAFLRGDAEEAERYLQVFVSNMLSYHDAGVRFPEQVYQAFVLGLFAAYEGKGYRVRSNRESGDGRPDVMIMPGEAGKPGCVVELKVVKEGKRAPEKVLRGALAQIHERGYVKELEAVGAKPVQRMAVAFDGKRVWVRAEQVV